VFVKGLCNDSHHQLTKQWSPSEMFYTATSVPTISSSTTERATSSTSIIQIPQEQCSSQFAWYVSYSIHSLCIVHISYWSTLKGTVPYISCRLFKLMGDVPRPSMIDHRASDNLESLFHILIKFTTMYEGPSGKASVEGVHPVNAPRWRKAYLMIDGDGLGTSGSLRVLVTPLRSLLLLSHPLLLKLWLRMPPASGSMASLFHSSSPPPISGSMTKETHLRPRHSRQKNNIILPPLPSLPSVGPNKLPGSGAGSMTKELPSKPRCSSKQKNRKQN
jgi:hypothetical protein